MKTLTCIVIGAGYAGIHAMNEIRKNVSQRNKSQSMKFILIDKNKYHLRKVMLFKPAVADEDICTPLTQLFPDGVELLQGTVTEIKATENKLLMHNHDDAIQELSYDILVVAAGSVARRPDESQGGLTLASLKDALNIRLAWTANMRQAAKELNPIERERLMTIAVVGAGISGIETAAELAYHVRTDAVQLGLNPDQVRIRLYNAHDRLFLDGPDKVAAKLEIILKENGVEVVHRRRVLQEENGKLSLSDGAELPIGLCVWTLGLIPNPIVKQWGLPVTQGGFVKIDASYRVQGARGIYSIGDCAKVVNPATGQTDGMTCKEAIPQAARLGKVVAADLEGNAAPTHTSYMESFSIGLGPKNGLTWVNKWGMDFMITGKMGYRIKQLVWNLGSSIK